MLNQQTQQAKAQLFHQLHHNNQMLVLPNIWDTLGAALLEDSGYDAVATASASVAFANGYDDGEQIPFDELLRILAKIAGSVSIPVTADIESGFSNSLTGLKENIIKVINTGVVGINIEDFDSQTNTLFDIATQCKKIALIKQTAAEIKIPIFINARTDVYIEPNSSATATEKLNEALKRGQAYIDAGADGFYPIAVKKEYDIQYLVSSLPCPVNILATQGVPDLVTLRNIGVARVSLGPGFLKLALQTMKDAALKLKAYQTVDGLQGNDITSDYLRKLIAKK